MITLAKGVYLNVIPTKKFKTIRVNVRFMTPLAPEVASKRVLLSSLLETNSLHYPTQTDVSKELEELYGAAFGLQVSRKGNDHFLTAVLNIVNEKFLLEKDVAKKSFAFLKEMLFFPNVKNGAFDEDTFSREQENLASYMDSIYEDKQSYAAKELQKLFFEDSLQQLPSYGSKEELMNLTPASLYTYYQQMIAEDEIVITVVGDVTESEAQAFFADFPFTDRELKEKNLLYQQNLKKQVVEKVESQDVTQAKLHLGYQTPASMSGHAYFTGLIFNGIFGGFPHSKLFMNVREKESLAYYASSSLDTYREFLSVQTGIEEKNKEYVLKLITRELENIQKGDITPLELRQTKENFKNQFLMQLDGPQGLMENAFRHFLTGETLSKDEWIENLESVTTEDVMAYSQEVKLQSIYFLKGE